MRAKRKAEDAERQEAAKRRWIESKDEEAEEKKLSPIEQMNITLNAFKIAKGGMTALQICLGHHPDPSDEIRIWLLNQREKMLKWDARFAVDRASRGERW